VLNTVSHSV